MTSADNACKPSANGPAGQRGGAEERGRNSTKALPAGDRDDAVLASFMICDMDVGTPRLKQVHLSFVRALCCDDLVRHGPLRVPAHSATIVVHLESHDKNGSI
jgi:hypothetical protein